MPVYSMTGYASATAGAGATAESGTNAEALAGRIAATPAASVSVELR